MNDSERSYIENQVVHFLRVAKPDDRERILQLITIFGKQYGIPALAYVPPFPGDENEKPTTAKIIEFKRDN